MNTCPAVNDRLYPYSRIFSGVAPLVLEKTGCGCCGCCMWGWIRKMMLRHTSETPFLRPSWVFILLFQMMTQGNLLFRSAWLWWHVNLFSLLHGFDHICLFISSYAHISLNIVSVATITSGLLMFHFNYVLPLLDAATYALLELCKYKTLVHCLCLIISWYG